MFKNYIEIDEMQEKFEDPKEVIRFVSQRRTDNTMAKRYHRGNQNP